MTNNNEAYTLPEKLLQILETMDAAPADPNTYKSDAEKFLEEARARREAARERLKEIAK